MGVDVDTGNVPSGESMFDSAINWVLGHGTIVAGIFLTIIVVGVVRALGGAVEGIAGKFSVLIGLLVLAALVYGYKTMG